MSPDDVLGFMFSGDGEGVYFVFADTDASTFTRVTLPIVHFSGHGFGQGTDADVSGNTPPSSPIEAEFLQEFKSFGDFPDFEDPAVQAQISELMDRWAQRMNQDLLINPPTCDTLGKRMGSIGS